MMHKNVEKYEIEFDPLLWIILGSVLVTLRALLHAVEVPIGLPPDEYAHLSYISDVRNSLLFLPDYVGGRLINSGGMNYLTHPPLYYTFMGVLGGIFDLDPIVHFRAYRFISAIFWGLGLVFFGLSLLRLGLPLVGVLGVMLSTWAFPMFSYLQAAVNNDAFAYLGISVAVFGLVNSIFDGDGLFGRPVNIYFIAFGVVVTLLSKANASLFLISLLAFTIVTRRNDFFGNSHREIAVVPSLLCGFVVIGYYASVKIFYGSFFPAPSKLYADVVVARPHDFLNYALIFFQSLLDRTFIVMSHASFSPYRFGSELVPKLVFLMLPLLFWMLHLGGRLLRVFERSKLSQFCDCLIGSVCVVILVHLVVGYGIYRDTGLFAGIQPRYYVFMLPIVFSLFFLLGDSARYHLCISGALFSAVCLSVLGHMPYMDSSRRESARATYQVNLGEISDAKSQLVSQNGGEVIGLRYQLDKVGLQGSRLAIDGWVYDAQTLNGPTALFLFYKGDFVGAYSEFNARPDVVRVHGLNKEALVGFRIDISSLEVGEDCSTLVVLARDALGRFVRIPLDGCSK